VGLWGSVHNDLSQNIFNFYDNWSGTFGENGLQSFAYSLSLLVNFEKVTNFRGLKRQLKYKILFLKLVCR